MLIVSYGTPVTLAALVLEAGRVTLTLTNGATMVHALKDAAPVAPSDLRERLRTEEPWP